MKSLSARRRFTAAFTLVEVALALGVASFCLVAVMGLVPLGVSTGQMASDQAIASSILSHVLADLRATPTTVPPGATTTSTEYAVAIPATGAAAQSQTLYFGDASQQFSFPSPQPAASPASTNSPPAGSRYRLTVNFLSSTGGRAATGVNLMVSWPPQVNPATGTPTGRVQIFAALDRN